TGKVERVRAQGVLHVVDYQTTDFVDAVHEITDARGVDLILDHIGAEYLSRNMRALAVSGKMVLIGVMGGVKAELHLAQLLVKRQQILGSVLRPRPIAEKAGIISTFAAVVLPHFAQGSIVPLIHSVFSLGEAAEAHRLMESSGHFGKIVLDMN
ncbi:MAG TPA: NAD(P)H-quinone oxidoreductase, partial [Gammaproteobacteria bacterium]|nr:NAD(P)H-quinone oxidoreductase [Gammaproteobacteria bacterium]